MRIIKFFFFKERPFQCPACDKCYAQKVGLKIHLEHCQQFSALKHSNLNLKGEVGENFINDSLSAFESKFNNDEKLMRKGKSAEEAEEEFSSNLPNFSNEKKGPKFRKNGMKKNFNHFNSVPVENSAITLSFLKQHELKMSVEIEKNEQKLKKINKNLFEL